MWDACISGVSFPQAVGCDDTRWRLLQPINTRTEADTHIWCLQLEGLSQIPSLVASAPHAGYATGKSHAGLWADRHFVAFRVPSACWQ